MSQLPYYLSYQAEILLGSGKDPELSVVRELCIQDNAFGSQTPINDWKLDRQMSFLGLLTQRLKVLGTNHKILALSKFSQT